jgi:ATP-dependent DNA helicase UvrD/PcrA
MPIDIKAQLNPSQYKAVTLVDKPVLVIAGAGSGKTRVIEYRVLHLIKKSIDPASILLLTFTRKASREMMSRAASHDSRCELIDGGTFHSFAFKTLKKYASKIGLSNSFSILDSGDSSELVGKCISKLGLLDLKKRLPKKEALKNIISKSINKQTSIISILEREYPQFEELAQELEQVKKQYRQEKVNADYVDYDDLLVYLKLLLEDPQTLEKVASRYNHIMVDEYQDTNKLQGDISYLLAKNHGNIMVVGDDAQSIYGFRGANHENIMQFPLRFPGCKIIKLEQNYRSTQEILDLGNCVLNNLTKKYSKNLSSAFENSGEMPEMNFFQNPYQEAEWIASTVKIMRDEGIDLSKQAVLFRSAYISIPLQAELSRAGIPFQVFGGMKFYETAHVKDMVSYLKILTNYKDELGWLRILKLLEGIGPKTAEQIFSILKKENMPTTALEAVRTSFEQNYKYSQNIVKLVDTLLLANNPDLGVQEKFRIMFEYYQPLLKQTYDEWQLRLADLETLINIASRYENLENLLADLALEPPEKGVTEIEAGYEDERPLTLSTIHSAKGLEWDAVFVIGLIDGIFPSRFALKFADQIEEEQRLFYVAVTRPKRKLFLSMHHEGNGSGFYQFNRVSRFIEDPQILKKIKQELIANELQCENQVLTHEELAGNVTDKKSLLKKINDSWKW